MLRVLYIDDEIIDRDYDVKVETITSAGYTVDTAVSPSEALERLRDKSVNYDAVILDILIPTDGTYSDEETNGGMNTGMRILQDIRTYRGDVTVLVVTVKKLSDAICMEEHGVIQGYLKRPASGGDIANKLDNILGRSK